MTALRSAGVWRTWLPRELGGFETAPREVVDLVVRLSEADTATGWCALIGIGTATAAAVLPRQGAEEMWSTGDEAALATALDNLVAEAAATGSASARTRISARLAGASSAHRCADVVTLLGLDVPEPY